MQLGKILLRQGKIDEKPVERRQRGDGIARIEILAQIDATDAEFASEGRPDLLLGDARVELLHLRNRLVALRTPLLQQYARHRASGRKTLRTGEVRNGVGTGKGVSDSGDPSGGASRTKSRQST